MRNHVWHQRTVTKPAINPPHRGSFAHELRNQTGGHLPCGCILVIISSVRTQIDNHASIRLASPTPGFHSCSCSPVGLCTSTPGAHSCSFMRPEFRGEELPDRPWIVLTYHACAKGRRRGTARTQQTTNLASADSARGARHVSTPNKVRGDTGRWGT